jgi:hypothetical protein
LELPYVIAFNSSNMMHGNRDFQDTFFGSPPQFAAPVASMRPRHLYLGVAQNAMVSPESKLPFKALIYRAALIWRIAELSREARPGYPGNARRRRDHRCALVSAREA